METKNFTLRWLLLLIFSVSALGTWAQTSQTPTQSVCPGTEPYLVIPGDAGNTFLWSISPGESPTNWNISTPAAASTNITWANPASATTYTVMFEETDILTGCTTIKTVDVTVNPEPVLMITDPLAVCYPNTVDLTLAAVTAGSTLPIGTNLTYWTDAGATSALVGPGAVVVSGTYYIMAETAEGCSDIESVTVTINPTPALVITNPDAVCDPNTVDLTLAAVTAGSTLPIGTNLTYWTDAGATIALVGPGAVAVSGTYYIMAETAEGCSDIESVTVTINPTPALVITNPDAVCDPNTVDLTLAAVTAGSTLPIGTNLTYWTDAGATIALVGPGAVAVSGTYYIMAETAEGCSDIESVTVTINPTPALVITNPVAVCDPNTVDLTLAAVTAGSTLPIGTNLTYWTDAGATIALVSPGAVAVSGTYYIKAETAEGCSDIESVNVTIYPLPTTSAIYHN